MSLYTTSICSMVARTASLDCVFVRVRVNGHTDTFNQSIESHELLDSLTHAPACCKVRTPTRTDRQHLPLGGVGCRYRASADGRGGSPCPIPCRSTTPSTRDMASSISTIDRVSSHVIVLAHGIAMGDRCGHPPRAPRRGSPWPTVECIVSQGSSDPSRYPRIHAPTHLVVIHCVTHDTERHYDSDQDSRASSHDGE